MLNLEAGDSGTILHLKNISFAEDKKHIWENQNFCHPSTQLQVLWIQFSQYFSLGFVSKKTLWSKPYKTFVLYLCSSLWSYASFHFHCNMNLIWMLFKRDRTSYNNWILQGSWT